MPAYPRLVALAALLALAACGGGHDEEREVMKPDETVLRDLVAAPGKVEDRSNAAVQAHQEALRRQLQESEGAPAG